MKSSKLNSREFFSLDMLKYDLPAGLVVFLVALPLYLGVALASEAPLLVGLIAGIVGGVVVSLLSGIITFINWDPALLIKYNIS